MDRPDTETAITAHGRDEAHTRGGRFSPVVVWLLAAILLILATWALRAAAAVMVPFVAALFIALAVAPVAYRIRRRMPRRLGWVGHAVAMALVVVILAAFFTGVYLAARQAVGQLPNVTEELGAAFPSGAAAEGAASPQAAGEEADATGGGGQGGLLDLGLEFGFDAAALLEQTAAYLAENASAFARVILSTAAAFIGGLVLVFFLVLLMLVEGPTWRDKVANAWSEKSKAGWEDTFAVMARSFRWYILVRTMLGAVTATLYVLWLWSFGIGLLIVWWVLAFLLNFIPTLGSIIAGALPIIYVLVTQDWTTALLIAAGIVAIEQVMGNYVDPRVQGKQLSVSPLVTFFALLLFGWMWGVIGALLAVPLAVFVVIACAHTPGLRPVGLLLSDCRDMDALRAMTTR